MKASSCSVLAIGHLPIKYGKVPHVLLVCPVVPLVLACAIHATQAKRLSPDFHVFAGQISQAVLAEFILYPGGHTVINIICN